MYQNYGNNRNNGYRSASYRKKRNKKRIRNRVIIVATGLLLIFLIIWMITGMFSCMCNGCTCGGANDAPVITETVDPNKNTDNKKPDNKKPKKNNDDSNANITTVFATPEIKDENPDSVGETVNGLYIWDKIAFEMFYGTPEVATRYADTVNKMQKNLGNIKVYSMIIPNHTEMGLPSRLKNVEGGATTTSQADFIKSAYENMNKKVTPINCYNELAKHCDEYIYFSSDHHWTGLGAYYAYKSFTDQTGQKAINLEDCEKHSIPDFTGSFHTSVGSKVNTDTVDFWTFPYEVPTTITNKNYETDDYSSCFYMAETSGSVSYGVFLWGDNPLEVIKSQCETAKDEKILIVHESYGNPLVPFFTYNYKEVHSIDFRYWKGNLYDYCVDNNITNVVFANGVMSAATATQLDAIESLLG